MQTPELWEKSFLRVTHLNALAPQERLPELPISQVRSISLAGRGGGLLRSGQSAPERNEVGEILRGGAIPCWEREIETELLKPLPRLLESQSRDPPRIPASPASILQRLRPGLNHVYPHRGAGLRVRSPRRLPPDLGPPCLARGAGPTAGAQAGFGGGSREAFAGEHGARGPEVVSI